MPHSSRGVGGSVGLVMDKISDGTLAGVSQSSIDFVAQSTQHLLMITLYFYFIYIFFGLGDKVKKNEIGGACSTSGGEERFIQGFGGET